MIFLIGGCEGSDKVPLGQSGRQCGLLACLESMLPVNAPVDICVPYGLQSFYCRALNGVDSGYKALSYTAGGQGMFIHEQQALGSVCCPHTHVVPAL